MNTKQQDAANRALKRLKQLAKEKRSTEDKHSRADGAVCSLLVALGCGDVADVYAEVKGLKT
jgi:hypothetical protein